MKSSRRGFLGGIIGTLAMRPTLEKVLEEKPVAEEEASQGQFTSSFSVRMNYRTCGATPMKMEWEEKIVTR